MEVEMKKTLVAVLVSVGLAGPAMAQAPNGPVSLVNPFTVGGLTDLTARFIVTKIQPKFPSGIAVVNRPGAGGSIGVTEVVQASPNGTTIALTPTASLVDQPQMNNLPYKTPDDFDPIVNTITYYQLLAVRGDAPWKDAKDLIAAARAKPNTLRIASSGIGTAAHLNLAQLTTTAKIDVVHVPFSGWAEGSAALLGGHIDALVVNPGEGRQLVNAKRIKILGAFQPARSRFYVEVPTFKELGYDAGVSLSFVVIAPNGLPAGVKGHFHDTIKAVLDDPSFQDFVKSREVEVNYMDGAATKAMLWSEYRQHTTLLETLGLRAK
jgi:tripartite-type tricarboxylate transporter receptor subunit TctC